MSWKITPKGVTQKLEGTSKSTLYYNEQDKNHSNPETANYTPANTFSRASRPWQ